MRVREALAQAPPALLRRIAAAHGLAPSASHTPAELADLVAERLGDRVYLADQVASLSPPEREALAAARASGGEVRGFVLARVLGSADVDALRPLVERGFLVRTFSPLGPHRGEVFAAPDEVLEALPEDAARPPAEERPPPATPPEREERRASDPAFNLFALLSVLRREPGATEAQRTAHLRDETAAWAEEPGGHPSLERWTFLRHLALAAGLLERHGDELGVAAGAARALAERPRLVQRLWRAYLRDRDWLEIARARVPHADDLAAQVDPPSLRVAALTLLARLPPGSWFGLADVLAWAERRAPLLLREHLDARGATLLDPASGEPLFGPGGWQRVESPWLRYLLLGPLYWLGAVAADAAGARVALTASGAALLAGDDPPPRPAEAVEWSEEGAVLLAPARADLGALLEAERYLVLEARGQPSRYRLRREQVAEALAAGGSLDECRRALERLSGGSLPPAVRERLEAWQERHGALALRPAVLLEGRAPEDLEAAQRLPEVARLLRARLGPTTAEVAASEVADLAAALRRAGHLPRVDAALRLMAGRRAYASLVDERVLEFLLLCLLALERAAPQEVARLEGASGLRERLEAAFPAEDVTRLRVAADGLARTLRDGPAPPRRKAGTRARRAPRTTG